MAAYSLDLRERVVRARARGVSAAEVAARFDVSLAWVYRLVQRRRQTGSIAPRKQTKFRGRALSSDEELRLVALITARPDATLAELQHALKLKAFLRAARPRNFDQVVELVAVALDLFSPLECLNFVRHCGYRVSTAL